jgi:hypothetical protein
MPCREQYAVILNTCYKYLNWPNPGLGSLPMAWKREGKKLPRQFAQRARRAGGFFI